MVKIPVKFKRLAAAFDEAARVVRSSESSGSEHSADLSDLVNSFLEREIREQRESGGVDEDVDGNESNDESDHRRKHDSDSELKDSLEKLFDRENHDVVKRSIQSDVEKALEEVTGDKNSSPDLKRRLMAWLRNRGLDAGLCKSKWEKSAARHPSGDYEYIDVNAGGLRYIVEVFPAGEFTIARPTGCYASLLDVFPSIFVGTPDELKQVVRLMCRAIRKSMKSVDLKVPPWRRLAYTETKWFGSYKRTTNEVTIRKGPPAKDVAGNRLVGFVPVAGASLHCREAFAVEAGVGIGDLAAALSNEEMLL